jgi:hypothetical protein
MLETIELKEKNIVVTKASEKLKKEDIEKIHSLICTILNKGIKVRWYFEMENFTGWDLPGFWEDIKMNTAHAHEYERIAMVGDKKWEEWVSQFMKLFTNAEIKYFNIDQKKEAKNWIESQ